MKLKYLGIALLALCASCDNTTDQMGLEILPDRDKINVSAAEYNISTRSFLSGSVYARSNQLYLGRYTDKEYGRFEASFATHFYCTNDFQPYAGEDQIIENTRHTEIQFSYYKKGGFWGDPLNTCGLKIYELEKSLPDEKESYYSNFNPIDYYNLTKQPLGETAYSARNFSVSDKDWNDVKKKVASVQINLPNSLGENIINLSKTNPEYFKNSETFAQHILKGIYVETVHGDGTVLYLNNLVLNVLNDIYVIDDKGKRIKSKLKGHETEDSIKVNAVIAQFAATKEVAHANRFINDIPKLQSYVNETNGTYIKTPAGIFTEATLPLDDIYTHCEENKKDTINSASFELATYNKSATQDEKDQLPYPSTLLMLRKSELKTFFEENKLYDNKTSYIAVKSTTNKYAFTNINNLINTCLKEKKEGKATADWNKVVFIPVSIIKDSSNKTVVAVQHDLTLSSAKFLGGTGGEAIKMRVIYTKFN